jgi:hypothetical protein
MRRFVFGLFIALALAFSVLFNLSVRAVQSTDTSATRTAIAITREPILGTLETPNSIDLTAVVAFKEYQDRIALSSNKSSDQLYATASAIVALVTQSILDLTATPVRSSTHTPTETQSPCILYLNTKINLNDINVENEVADTLTGSPLQGSAFVVDVELSMPDNCPTETHFLHTDVEIPLGVDNIQDDSSIIKLVEEVLSHLQNSQLRGDARSLRLSIGFTDNRPVDYCQGRLIDTGYNNARLAYQEGLRGQKLIEALGGVMDTKLCQPTPQ